MTTSDVTDEDVMDELNQGQNQIISEINTDKSITISLVAGINSYALTTDEETQTQETTTMKDFVNYDLIGVKNGINTVFTYPTMPDAGHAIMVFFNGVKLDPETDYELTRTTISVYITLLTMIPTSEDYLDANYFEES